MSGPGSSATTSVAPATALAVTLYAAGGSIASLLIFGLPSPLPFGVRR